MILENQDFWQSIWMGLQTNLAAAIVDYVSTLFGSILFGFLPVA